MAIELPCISTGRLPGPELVQPLLTEAHRRFRSCTDGRNADYIPALAQVPSELFGICLTGVSGGCYRVGDTERPFTIQSISKPFVFGLVCQAIGEEEARLRLGVNSTGLPFNSVIAVERTGDGLTNPMVNAGAIATTSLAPGETAEAKWRYIRDGLSRFAGRPLALDEDVYRSEAAANQRNTGIASLLQSYDRIYFDPIEATDVYTHQCSLTVTTCDLAVMAATLANGGVNPLTGKPVIDAIHCEHVLAVMVTAGLYESSGDWLYDVGLPGKSGVSGGMISVAPGKGALATFAPPLDAAGNSVRGRLTARFLSERLGLNLFASAPAVHTPTR
jgi:glutaminase